MGSSRYIVAIILAIAWVIGFFVLKLGNVTHFFLADAIIAVLVRDYHKAKRSSEINSKTEFSIKSY
jgi:hypothetical protein